MIPINGSNSSGVDLNKYVLKNVFNNVVNDLSDKVNKNKIDIEDIKNKVDGTNDKFEWLAFDVSNEYTSQYNMKRCFNKYGDKFLIRSTSVSTIGEEPQVSGSKTLTIHYCEVNTMYGPNIQYNFISDYVYLPAWIRDKDNEKIIYHIVNCTFVLNKDTVNCTAKMLEFGEGWNNIIVNNSDTVENIKINSDCNAVDISNNSALKDINLNDCYKLTGVYINNNPNIKNKCFLMRCTPSTFSTNNNNNTYLDTSQNWFISGDGMWRGKFIGGWHNQDVEFFDRFGNGLIARILDSDNDSGYYKSIAGHDIITDYFKFPSMVAFSNDLYNDKRLVRIPRVAMNVYTDATFETKNINSNARILDFSNGIDGVDWSYDNKVEKIILSPSVISLNLNYDTALSSINLVDCDKLVSLTIQNCPNITQVVLQHRPTTLNVGSIKLIVVDEMENTITTLSTRVLTLENKPQTTYSRYTIENYEARPGDPDIQRVNEYFAFSYVKKITDNETGYIYYWDNGNKILFEALDNDGTTDQTTGADPKTHLLPSCPNIGLAWYEFYVSGPQNFSYNKPYTAIAGFDLSNGAITTFKIAKLDAPWDRIYIPPNVHTFEMIECFQLVGGPSDSPTEIIKFPSTGFINTDTDTSKFVIKTVSLTASV